jgi:hypothetical protein
MKMKTPTPEQVEEMYVALTAVIDSWAAEGIERHMEVGGWFDGSLERARCIVAALEVTE